MSALGDEIYKEELVNQWCCVATGFKAEMTPFKTFS